MDSDVLAIQQLYPRIYHACHRGHGRARTGTHRLSERDSAILAHLGQDGATTARELGRHLGIGAPTLSQALTHLERNGYVARAPRRGRSPARALSLTELGVQALAATSVLDAEALAAVLEELTPAQRRAAVRGLRLLADAALTVTRTASRRSS